METIYLPWADLFQAEGDYRRAMQLYAKSWRNIKSDPSSWSYYLLDLATLAEALGQHELVVRLLSTTEAVVEATGYRLFPDYRKKASRLTTITGARLGDARFDTAWALGRTQEFVQVAEEAISILEALQPSHASSSR